ncbi:MAG: hypothetical protein SFW63_07200 [Alphaproteobacteria bacterium]|nr:hypothetical protein [Alphaproteobacteria bacterium]
MNIKKLIFFTATAVFVAILWAAQQDSPSADADTSGAALPTNGLVGKTVSDAAREASSTVPVAAPSSPQN